MNATPSSLATDGPAVVTFPALGSTAVVAVSDPRRLDAARAAVEVTIGAFDLACSRFREDSELTAVNAAAGSPVRVGPILLDAVAAALRAARLTNGAVDPTVGMALIALGYDRDFASVGESAESTSASAPTASAAGTSPGAPTASAADTPPGASTASADHPSAPRVAAVPGWRTVKLDLDAGTVRVPRGVKLDLGATAKALAADRAAEAAFEAAGCGVLVGLGGDISLAGPPPGPGWLIRVTDDHRSDTHAPGQWITLRSGGLATSSATVRRWHAQDGWRHHVIDPTTGLPAVVVWRTVSVVAASCVDANTATTAAIVRGAGAIDWLEGLGLASRLVGVDGSVRHIAGWPSEGDDLG